MVTHVEISSSDFKAGVLSKSNTVQISEEWTHFLLIYFLFKK